jgi:hypothetical protein
MSPPRCHLTFPGNSARIVSLTVFSHLTLLDRGVQITCIMHSYGHEHKSLPYVYFIESRGRCLLRGRAPARHCAQLSAPLVRQYSPRVDALSIEKSRDKREERRRIVGPSMKFGRYARMRISKRSVATRGSRVVARSARLRLAPLAPTRVPICLAG